MAQKNKIHFDGKPCNIQMILRTGMVCVGIYFVYSMFSYENYPRWLLVLNSVANTVFWCIQYAQKKNNEIFEWAGRRVDECTREVDECTREVNKCERELDELINGSEYQKALKIVKEGEEEDG